MGGVDAGVAVFVRSKIVKGNRYYCLVENRRDGARVRQRVVKWLGRGA